MSPPPPSPSFQPYETQLTELSAAVWHRYEMPMRELLEAEPEYRDPAQQNLFGFDDLIPF